jgi:hypothetical protein
MTRLVLVLGSAALVPHAARAEILPSFDPHTCAARASHVVVVNDRGAVLESWRGDLRPGDRVPLDAMNLTLEQDIGKPFGLGAAEERKKVTGKRLVVFLKRDEPGFGRGQEVGGWAPADRFGWFNVSVAWIEDGRAFALQQWINPGPQVMSSAGTEKELQALVEKVNKRIEGTFAKARATKDLGTRADLLAGVVIDAPGFAADALVGLGWCGADALPALRRIVNKEFAGRTEHLAAYRVMVHVGAAARDDLMKPMEWLYEGFKGNAARIEYNEDHKIGFNEDERYWHQLLRALTADPAAFAGATARQREQLTRLRDLWAKHPVLSKLDEPGNRVHDRLDRALAHGRPGALGSSAPAPR